MLTCSQFKMTNLAQLLVTCFAVFQVGYCQTAKVLSTKVLTAGYLKSGTERTEQLGVTVHMDRYTKQGQDCLMVMRIEQTTPWKTVDEVMVSCDAASWAVKNSLLSYGAVVYIHTTHNSVDWALFDTGKQCVQRTYKDRGTQDLVRLEAVLTRAECNRAVQTQRYINKLTRVVRQDTKSNPNKDVDSGVLAMDGDVGGYTLVGSKNTVTSGAAKVEVSFYHKDGVECVRLVVIYTYDLEVQKLKVSCGRSNGRDVNGNFQFGKAFTIRPQSGNNVFNILYHIPDQLCIRRTYTAVKGDPSQATKITKITQSTDERNDDKECTGLKEGKDVVSPNRWVIEMSGNMKGYRKGELQLVDDKGDVQLESQVYYEADGNCVTLGVIRLQDTVAQQFKMPCGEMKGRREKQHYQLGSVFVVRAGSETGVYKGLFNFQNQHCYGVTYTVDKSDPKKITKSRRKRTRGQECTDLMDGKDLISVTPDPKSTGNS